MATSSNGFYPPELPNLNLPAANLRVSCDADGDWRIFDALRKKKVALTPEEWVRQNFTAWLINGLHYPPSLMANEIGIELNGTKRRCDTVVFEPNGSILCIVEYKAPGVNVSQSTFDQIARYNLALHARYLIVSNGIRHFCCVMDYSNDSYHFIPSIPDYQSLKKIWSEN